MAAMSSATDTLAPPASPLFRAVITPNISLSPRGVHVVFGLLIAVNSAVALVFLLRGAWPVVPFLGLDVVLVAVAFAVCRRRAHAFEEVRLTERELLVRRVAPGGATEEHRFDPYWVRLARETAEEEGLVRLRLTSHGRSLTIAHALSPPERASFARALEGAIAGLRGRA
jgi:uncharacterized membrane protein